MITYKNALGTVSYAEDTAHVEDGQIWGICRRAHERRDGTWQGYCHRTLMFFDFTAEADVIIWVETGLLS